MKRTLLLWLLLPLLGCVPPVLLPKDKEPPLREGRTLLVGSIRIEEPPPVSRKNGWWTLGFRFFEDLGNGRRRERFLELRETEGAAESGGSLLVRSLGWALPGEFELVGCFYNYREWKTEAGPVIDGKRTWNVVSVETAIPVPVDGSEAGPWLFHLYPGGSTYIGHLSVKNRRLRTEIDKPGKGRFPEPMKTSLPY